MPITATDDYKFDKLKAAAKDRNVNVMYMKEGDTYKFKDDYFITILSPNEGSLKNEKRDQMKCRLLSAWIIKITQRFLLGT